MVLQRDEATDLENAALQLISKFHDSKPEPPSEPSSADLAAASSAQGGVDSKVMQQWRHEVAQRATAACDLFKMLCAKRPSLLRKYCDVFCEEGQDEAIKVRWPSLMCADKFHSASLPELRMRGIVTMVCIAPTCISHAPAHCKLRFGMASSFAMGICCLVHVSRCTVATARGTGHH